MGTVFAPSPLFQKRLSFHRVRISLFFHITLITPQSDIPLFLHYPYHTVSGYPSVFLTVSLLHRDPVLRRLLSVGSYGKDRYALSARTLLHRDPSALIHRYSRGVLASVGNADIRVLPLGVKGSAVLCVGSPVNGR